MRKPSCAAYIALMMWALDENYSGNRIKASKIYKIANKHLRKYELNLNK